MNLFLITYNNNESIMKKVGKKEGVTMNSSKSARTDPRKKKDHKLHTQPVDRFQRSLMQVPSNSDI